MKLSALKLLTGAATIAIVTVLATIAIAGGTAETPASGIVRSWNAAVTTIEPEDANFQELLESYKLNPPGRVILAPDARDAQKKHRLELIARIVASHEARIRAMKDLARFESALP